jgi:hypothetical protein
MMNFFFPALVAGVASWLFGAVFYTVLGNAWIAALGTTKEAMMDPGGKPNPVPFVLSFLLQLVMATVFITILRAIDEPGLVNGLKWGFLIWFGFILSTIATNYAYAKRDPLLTFIDSGHYLGVLLIQGAILGAWGLGSSPSP